MSTPLYELGGKCPHRQFTNVWLPLQPNWLGDHPQPDSDQAVDGMRHVGYRVLLVLFHCLCYKNDVILNDQSNI